MDIHLRKFSKIPLERYADIYIFGIDSKDYKEKRKKLMNFLYQLEYLEKVQSLIMDIYNEYSKHNEEIMNEWNNCQMNLQKLYLSINYDDNPKAERFYIFFKNAVDKTSQSFNLDTWKSEYIHPTLNLIKEKPSPESILFQIAILTRDLNITIVKGYESNKYSEVFAGYVTNLKKSRDIIDKFKNYFDNKRIKYFCK